MSTWAKTYEDCGLVLPPWKLKALCNLLKFVCLQHVNLLRYIYHLLKSEYYCNKDGPVTDRTSEPINLNFSFMFTSWLNEIGDCSEAIMNFVVHVSHASIKTQPLVYFLLLKITSNILFCLLKYISYILRFHAYILVIYYVLLFVCKRLSKYTF